jgi:dihydrofolate reductase
MNHTISLVAAMNRDRVIGAEGAMPWHLPNDLRWFKSVTRGKPVIMGRGTWAAIGRALPQRPNLVITRRQDFQAPGASVVHSLEQALDHAADHDEIMIIGGANLFQQTIALADRLYLTVIDAAFDGDTWFPLFDTSEWREIHRADQAADDANPYPHSFLIWQRTAD